MTRVFRVLKVRKLDGMNKMILPPDVEFHEDIRVLVWRPRGLLNRAAVNRIITVIGELETTLEEPFNRFADTLAAHAVDLNFEHIIRVSVYRRFFLCRSSTGKDSDSRDGCYSYSLRPVACLTDSQFCDQNPRIPRLQGSHALAWRTSRTTDRARVVGPFLLLAILTGRWIRPRSHIHWRFFFGTSFARQEPDNDLLHFGIPNL